jgi:UDP-N-acetylmuramate: L-alanyl-gamma-D-glutamyl-meso-diaminopimelate ligase
LEWSQIGAHNIHNALAAIAAARHAGVPPVQAIAALERFSGVKRRMELSGEASGVRVYDDFAHHPTAIASTLRGLRAQVGDGRIIAVLEPRSNTMRMGVFKNALAESLSDADLTVLYQAPDLGWDLADVVAALGSRGKVCDSVAAATVAISKAVRPGDHVLIMSNGGFGGIHRRLLEALQDGGLPAVAADA